MSLQRLHVLKTKTRRNLQDVIVWSLEHCEKQVCICLGTWPAQNLVRSSQGSQVSPGFLSLCRLCFSLGITWLKEPLTCTSASRISLAVVAVCPKYLDMLNYSKHIQMPQLLNMPLASKHTPFYPHCSPTSHYHTITHTMVHLEGILCFSLHIAHCIDMP